MSKIKIGPREVLETCDRTLGGVTASPSGLYLVKVHYGEEFSLSQHIRWPAIANE